MALTPVAARRHEVRRVLMVAFHFPPFLASSGLQRTLRFVQHLPAYGWQPLVLSAHPRAFPESSNDLLPQIPADTVVERAFALDAARHLSVAGRYPGFLARPDRWSSWALGAIPAGLRMIRRFRPDVIWSTYPIASAHLIAHRLHALSGIPWVADFRDPMAQDGYPSDPATWRSFRRIEEAAARHAVKLVFVTPSALALYRSRFQATLSERFTMIENGFDEDSFADAEKCLDRSPLNPGRLTLLHSGIVYPAERDPRALFTALGRLLANGLLDASTTCIRFRASKLEGPLHELAQKTGTQDLVEILPPIAYRDALQEMMRADGLLIMQGSNCNEQIPAKLYEYLRAGRPILGLADDEGDTASVMRDAGVTHLARLEDADAVSQALMRFLSCLGEQTAAPTSWSGMSRSARAGELSTVLDQAASSRQVIATAGCGDAS